MRRLCDGSPGNIRAHPINEVDRRYGEIPRTGRLLLYCHCPGEEIAIIYGFLKTTLCSRKAIAAGYGGSTQWSGRRSPSVLNLTVVAFQG